MHHMTREKNYPETVILVGLLCCNLPLLDQGPTPYIELDG